MSIAAPAATSTPVWRRIHLRRILIGALVLLVLGALAYLLGWDLRGWFSDLWDTMTEISAKYLIAAVALKTVQTTLTAFGWYSILRFAYPDRVRSPRHRRVLRGVGGAERDPAGEPRHARAAA